MRGIGQPIAGGHRGMIGPGQKGMLARSSGFDKAAQKGMTQLKANQKPLMKVSMQEREEKSEGME